MRLILRVMISWPFMAVAYVAAFLGVFYGPEAFRPLVFGAAMVEAFTYGYLRAVRSAIKVTVQHIDSPEWATRPGAAVTPIFWPETSAGRAAASAATDEASVESPDDR